MLSFGQANELIQTALEAEQTDFVKLRWAITGERLGYDWDEFYSKLKKKNSKSRSDRQKKYLTVWKK